MSALIYVETSLERAPEPKRTQSLALLDPLPLLESPADADGMVVAYLAQPLDAPRRGR